MLRVEPSTRRGPSPVGRKCCASLSYGRILGLLEFNPERHLGGNASGCVSSCSFLTLSGFVHNPDGADFSGARGALRPRGRGPNFFPELFFFFFRLQQRANPESIKTFPDHGPGFFCAGFFLWLGQLKPLPADRAHLVFSFSLAPA